MIDDNRTGAGRTTKKANIRDLSHLVALGARIRRLRYMREARSFLVPVLVTICLQALAYLLIYVRTDRTDWQSGGLTILVLAAVPILSGITLTAFRRPESPILAAVVVVLTHFSFAVSFLSAMRISLSYAGLAAAMPIALLLMAFANIRFHRSMTTRVGLITFDGAGDVIKLLDAGVTLIKAPDADLSQFEIVLIEPSKHHTAKWSDMLAHCYLSGIEIMPWTRFLEIRHGRVDVATFELSHLAYSPSQVVYARSKRVFDILSVLVTLPLTLPLVAITALYIFALDGGPVLFIQHRFGFGGRVFRLYNFRTMRKGTGGGATLAEDNRIIPGCGFLRRTRIDELPQLYNILIADMSLIGPRPEAMDLVRWYRSEIPQWDYRLLLLPGITGWAQVNSGYTSNPDEARTKLSFDLYYIKHLSMDLDLQILFKTIRTIIFGTGAR